MPGASAKIIVLFRTLEAFALQNYSEGSFIIASSI